MRIKLNNKIIKKEELKKLTYEELTKIKLEDGTDLLHIDNGITFCLEDLTSEQLIEVNRDLKLANSDTSVTEIYDVWYNSDCLVDENVVNYIFKYCDEYIEFEDDNDEYDDDFCIDWR